MRSLSRTTAIAALLVSAPAFLPAQTAAAPTVLAARKAPTVPTAPATWAIDPVHSEMTFRVRHLTGRVRGSFAIWQGTVVADPAQLGAGTVEVTVDAKSIDTGNADRDKHLRSSDFLDVEKFPQITFRSTKVTPGAGKALTVEGILTIHGVSRPVKLASTLGGTITDPWGAQRIAFEGTTRINRRDFGLTWSKLVEGTALVGDEIDIDLAIEAVKK